MDGGAWWAKLHVVARELDMTLRLSMNFKYVGIG